MNKLPTDKNRRVLVIDDNRAIHDDFRKILSPATAATAALDATEAALFGPSTAVVAQTVFEVSSAYQGQEGVQRAQSALAAGQPYAMAFVDVRMPPGWDGVETTAKLWELDPDLQVVICTAHSDYSWSEMFARLGQRDGLLILKKPFDAVEAFQLAHALTEKWWLHQQSRRKMEELKSQVAERTRELQQTNHTLEAKVVEQNRTEKELQWKTAFLEAQVNSSIDGILVVDEQNRKILQNQRTTDLLKIPPHIAEDKDDAQQLRWVAGQVKNPAPFFEKVTYLNSHPDQISRDEIELKDGTMLDRYSAPVVDQAGKYYGRIWTFRDITERKQTEAALRESEERFAGAFEQAPIGVALVGPTGLWLKVNRSLCELVGYSEAELLARTFQDITYPGDHEADQEIVRGLIAGDLRTCELEKRYIHARGHLVTVLINVSLVRDGLGQPWYFIAQIQDVTERRRTEEALRLLGSAVEQAKEAVLITDAELDLPGPSIVFVNPAFTAMTGYGAAEVMGKTPRILQGPRTDKTVLHRLRQNLERGEIFEGEAINYRKDGTEFTNEWQIVPLRQPGGEITHFVALQRDITARKRLEAKLFQSQKMETVGKLAGGVAHDFNSILTAIMGQTELLLGDLPAGSPLIKNATEISKAATRAATLTRQLLAFGRKAFLRTESIDLNLLIASMEGLFRTLMGGDVETQTVLAPGLHTVKADAGQLEQVIINLAMNAADAMPNGGRLTLETANVVCDPESEGRYPELKPGHYIMLAITDTGSGMSEEVRARAFEPFFTTKDVGQGTGLGLSTCYGIVKQSGGHISVYSEVGRGTTFKIYLPQAGAPAKSSLPRLDSPDLPRGTETILLAEDDPALREMAATLLRRLGYTVLTAANGVEALSLKHQPATGHVDLLFTDVVMPQMSGKELSDRVRKLYPRTKILFTSAYTEQAIVHQGVLDTGVALLQKPFTPSALARKVREVLDAPSTADNSGRAPQPTGVAKNSAAANPPENG